MPDERIDWPTRAYIEREADRAVDEAERRIRTLFGVSSEAALEEMRETVRFAHRQRKAAEARADQVNKGMIDGFLKAFYGFLTAAVIAAATWIMNGGHKP